MAWINRSKNLEVFGESTDSGATSPGTVVSIVGDGKDWSNPSNATASDNSYATSVMSVPWPTLVMRDQEVKIVKSDGSIGTTNKADTSTNWGASDAYAEYGGSSDLWDEDWTAEGINNSNFGVVIKAKLREAGDPDSSDVSDYLKATNFGFNIPTGATINGIKVEIEKKTLIPEPEGTAYVDHIRITIYYTTISTWSSQSKSSSISPTNQSKS